MPISQPASWEVVGKHAGGIRRSRSAAATTHPGFRSSRGDGQRAEAPAQPQREAGVMPDTIPCGVSPHSRGSVPSRCPRAEAATPARIRVSLGGAGRAEDDRSLGGGRLPLLSQARPGRWLRRRQRPQGPWVALRHLGRASGSGRGHRRCGSGRLSIPPWPQGGAWRTEPEGEGKEEPLVPWPPAELLSPWRKQGEVRGKGCQGRKSPWLRT